MTTLKAGDYVRVTQTHRSIREGTFWQIEEVVSPEEAEDTTGYYIGNCTDGSRGGYDLDIDKVELVTEGIPFRVAAIVQLDILTTIRASSEKEAINIAKSDYSELIDDFDEMDGTVLSAWPTDL